MRLPGRERHRPVQDRTHLPARTLGLEDVELATLTYIDWFNHRRILEPIGDIPPAEYEENNYAQLATTGN